MEVAYNKGKPYYSEWNELMDYKIMETFLFIPMNNEVLEIAKENRSLRQRWKLFCRKKHAEKTLIFQYLVLNRLFFGIFITQYKHGLIS